MLRITTHARIWRFARKMELFGKTTMVMERAAYKSAGLAIAEAIGAYRKDPDYDTAEAVADALNGAIFLTASQKDAIRDKFNMKVDDSDHELVCCRDCHDYFVGAEDMTNVEDTGYVCEDCITDDKYRETVDGSWHNINNVSLYPVFGSVSAAEDDSPDGWTTRQYGRNNLYSIEHNNYTYAYMFDSYDQSRWEEIQNEDDDDVLPDYHDAHQREDGEYFDEQNKTTLIPALGIEVEVYTSSVRGALETLQSNRNSLISNMIYERDGSLHEGNSFEVVTPPLGQTEWATFGPDLCNALTNAGTVGYNTPGSTRYGIHINVHRRHLSPLAEARILMFLCAEQNKHFVQAIAQRPSVYHPDVDIGQLMPGTKVYAIGGRKARYGYSINTEHHSGKIQGVGKYAPLQLKTDPDIAEFRLFQSTLNPKSFMKNIEFVYALWAWTKPSSGTGNSWAHTDFLTWLNAPQRRKDYPHLVEYLSRKQFKIKGGYTIQNEWLAHITKPVDEDFVELQAA